MRNKNVANIVRPVMPIARSAAPRLRSRTTVSGSSGWATRRSTMTNAASAATPYGQRHDRERRGPAVHLGVGEPVHEREHRAHAEQHAGHVDPGPRRRAPAVEQPDGGECRGHGEHDVHVHRPAPVEQLRERAAEQQAGRGAGAADRSVDAERLRSLLWIGERRRQHGEHGRGEQRRKAALHGARADQHFEARCRPADGGRAREAQQADDERRLAADEVADPPAQQQQRPERECVCGDHPLARVVAEREVGLRRREGDVHDGDVEDDHELGERDRGQDEPAARVLGFGHVRMTRRTRRV